MNTYCLPCKKDKKNIDPKAIKNDVIKKSLFAIIKSLHLFQKDLVYLKV